MRKVLLFLSALALSIAPLSAAHASGHYTVTVLKNHTHIELGSSITISGHVAGGPVSGRQVDIHAYEGNNEDDLTPYHVGHANLSSGGNYSKTYKLPTGGTFFFRVSMHSVGSVHGKSTQTPFDQPLKVYRWTSIANYFEFGTFETPFEDPSANVTSGKKVHGKVYDHEYFVRQGHTLVFGDMTNCNAFDGYVGISDNSQSGITATPVLKADDTSIYSHVTTQGHSAHHVTLDLDDPSELSLAPNFDGSPGINDKLILGSTKLHCATP